MCLVTFHSSQPSLMMWEWVPKALLFDGWWSGPGLCCQRAVCGALSTHCVPAEDCIVPHKMGEISGNLLCFNLYWLVFTHFFSVLTYLFLVSVKSKNSAEICSPAAWSDRLVLTTGLPPLKKKKVSWKDESWKYKISVAQQIKIWNTGFEGSL